MRIAVFGLGYVGSVTAVCLARDGHTVFGVEKDPLKLGMLRCGIPPVSEPGLAEELASVLGTARFRLTEKGVEAVRETDIALICVGTPTSASGGTDLGHVVGVVEEVARARRAGLKRHGPDYTAILRSTVPPGTTRSIFQAQLAGLPRGSRVQLCFNPEFLREGTALGDYAEPALTVIGLLDEGDEATAGMVRRLYEGVPGAVIQIRVEEAEMLKLASNAFHALKVAFANEMGALAAAVGASPLRLMEVFAQDTKLNISRAYLRPGFAFGGSCLPKDLRAIRHIAAAHGLRLPVSQAVLPSNEEHIERVVRRVCQRGVRCVGVAGLAFKADTDDLRESAALILTRRLVDSGHEVLIFDPLIDPKRLVGANLAYAASVLPGLENLLVPWEELSTRAELCLVTRAGLVSDHMAACFKGSVEWLHRMTQRA